MGVDINGVSFDINQNEKHEQNKEIWQIGDEVRKILKQEQCSPNNLGEKFLAIEVLMENLREMGEFEKILEQKEIKLKEEEEKIKEMKKQKNITEEVDEETKENIYKLVKILEEKMAKQKQILTQKSKIIKESGIEEYEKQKSIIEVEIEKQILALIES